MIFFRQEEKGGLSKEGVGRGREGGREGGGGGRGEVEVKGEVRPRSDALQKTDKIEEQPFTIHLPSLPPSLLPLQPLPESHRVPHQHRPPSLPPSLPPYTQHPSHPSSCFCLFLPPVLPPCLPSVGCLSIGGLEGGREGVVELSHQQPASRVLTRDESMEGREGGREGELGVGGETTPDGGGEVVGFLFGGGGGRGREGGRGGGTLRAAREGGRER